MFTLKWIATGGAEMIYSAENIVYTPREAIAPALIVSVSTVNPEPARILVGRDFNRPCVNFDLTDSGVNCSIDSGHVYVMNENGRTVSNWLLSEAPKYAQGMGLDGAAADGSMTLTTGNVN